MKFISISIKFKYPNVNIISVKKNYIKMELVKMKSEKMNRKNENEEEYNQFKRLKSKKRFQRNHHYELTYLSVSLVNR